VIIRPAKARAAERERSEQDRGGGWEWRVGVRAQPALRASRVVYRREERATERLSCGVVIGEGSANLAKRSGRFGSYWS